MFLGHVLLCFDKQATFRAYRLGSIKNRNSIAYKRHYHNTTGIDRYERIKKEENNKKKKTV